MDELAPLGPVYQAGTLSGNPLATAAGLAVLDLLDDDAYALIAVAGRLPRRVRWPTPSPPPASPPSSLAGARCVGLFFGATAPHDYDLGLHHRRGALRPLLPRHARRARRHRAGRLRGHVPGPRPRRRRCSPPSPRPPARRGRGRIRVARRRPQPPAPAGEEDPCPTTWSKPPSTPTWWCSSAPPATWPPRRSSRPSRRSSAGAGSAMPVVGVASSEWTDDDLRARAEESVAAAGGLDASWPALRHRASAT